MPLQTPTLRELVERIRSDIEGELSDVNATLRRSNARIMSIGLAGAFYGVYGFARWVKRQLFVETCDVEILPIYGRRYKVPQNEATFAEYDIEITGTDGETLSSGTKWQREDGAKYTTDADATISSGTAIVKVIADTAGADSNLDAGDELTIVQPVAGINNTATVQSGGKDGADEEDPEVWRDRILDKIRSFKEEDYVVWAREVAGVTRAWAFPHRTGLGYVDVTFARDDDGSGSGTDIIPDASEVTEVQDHIDSKRPPTAKANVFAPAALTIDFEIAATPDTQEVRDAIEAQLKDLIRRDGGPEKTVLHSRMREAISTAPGEEDHDLNAPTTDQTATSGELHVMGTITWV